MTDLDRAIDLVCDECNVNRSISTVYDRVIREINRVSSEIWDGFRWSFRWRNYRIVTDVDYTTGTVTATNGSRTITGSGTTFLSAHIGWHISFDNDTTLSWYRIRAFTSSTQIELDAAYQGTTGSSKAYTLRHFDYILPTEPWDLGSVAVTHERGLLNLVEPTSIDIMGPVPNYSGSPNAISIYGSDSIARTYSVGTVSGTVGTSALTGVGTSWLGHIYAGDEITIGNYTYTIRSVETDTSIVLYNAQQITSSAATYTITRRFGRIARILWPSNTNYVLDIRALRKYNDLVHTTDTNELLYRFPDTVIKKVSALELKRQGDIRHKEVTQSAETSLARAKAEDDAGTPREHVAPIFTYRRIR